MFSPKLTEDQLNEVAQLHRELGSVSAVAARLGLARSTVLNRLRKAAVAGFFGGLSMEVHPTFEIARISTHVDKDGNKSGWIIQQPEPMERAALMEGIKDAFSAYEGAAEPSKPPETCLADLLVVYPVVDHHLGLLAWAPETGNNYDLAIGQTILMETLGALVAKTPASETAILLNVGDFFHADNQLNETQRSHNRLDVDGRWSKVLQTGVALMINAIDLLLQKHQNVIVRNLPGNHDPHSAQFLTVALAAFYSREPRVKVDLDPSPFFVYEWGNVMIASTHGDQVKGPDLPGVAAAMWPQIWGRTVYRYGILGHLHQKILGGDRHGLMWEIFQASTGKDAWTAANGFLSGRSMVAIVYHKEFGEDTRFIQAIRR